ncbi:MAG: FIST C-terminal domain-containing protein [Alphaproteobacteria bacterium]|nr:FIST C-terminal domain-containing protein [Alphaproteobacteria bacterium SS10]
MTTPDITTGPFRLAVARGQDWKEVAKRCLDDLGAIGGANIGFIYVTDALVDDLGSILTLLRGITGIEDWVGSVGIGIVAGSEEILAEPALTLMVGHLPVGSFQLFRRDSDGFGEISSDTMPVADWLTGRHAVAAVIHGDPRDEDLPRLIMDTAADTEAFLVGGLSSSRVALKQVAGKIIEQGVSGVFFDENVSIATGLTQGCTPVSPARPITECEDNVIMTVEGRPALEVFKEDIAETLSGSEEQTEAHVFAALPVSGSDTGDYLVRNILGVDNERGWIAISEEVEEGQLLQFVQRNTYAAMADMEQMLRRLKERMPEPRGALYFSCMARGENMFGPDSAEVRAITDIFGEIPMAGIFANGEISHDRLYTHTGILMLFG